MSIVGYTAKNHPQQTSTAADAEYRLCWRVEGMADKCAPFTMPHRSLATAESDRAETESVPYVTEAWVEVAEWRRVDAPSRADGDGEEVP